MGRISLLFLAGLFLGATDARSESRADSRIGEAYLSLMSKARARSPEVLLAQAQYDQKSAHSLTALARWLPRADLQLAQTRSKDYSFITSGAFGSLASAFTPQETPLSRWAVNLTLPVYRRAVHLEYQQSNLDRELASSQLDAKVAELDWHLRSLVGNVLLSAYREANLENSIGVARTHLKEARLRFELGQKTRVDVLRAESNLVSLESQRYTDQQRRRSDLSALIEYGGVASAELEETGLPALLRKESDISQAIFDFAQIDGAIEKLGSQLEDTPPRITEKSHVFRSYLQEHELADSRARSSMALEWPELLLQGSLNKQGPTWGEAFSAGNQSYSMGVVVNIPIFSTGSLLMTYSEKSNAQRAALLKADRDILHFRNELENTQIQIRALRKSLESLKLHVDQTEEIVKLSFKSYQLGKATLVELQGAQSDGMDAKVKYAQARLELATLIRRFAWNLGESL